MSLKLRPYKPADAAKIHLLFHASVHQLTHREYNAEQRQCWANNKLDGKFWKERLASTRPTVALINNDVAGFIELITDQAYIDCLYVHPIYAGRGIGEALLRHALHQADEKGIAVVSVDVSLTALPLFNRLGFKQVCQNQIVRDGVKLTNWRMEKQLRD